MLRGGWICPVWGGSLRATYPVGSVMAKIISLPISGKVGLTVDMPGRYGQIRRAWVVPSNPETQSQLAVRARLMSAVSGFRALTEAKQNQWNAAAAQQFSKSRLGTNGPLTGMQLYVKLNTTLAMFGEEPIDEPPGLTVLGLPAPQNLVITNTGGTIAMTLTCPSSPGENTVVRASAGVSSAVRRPPAMVVLGTCPAPVQGSASILSLFTAKHGAPVPGTRVFVQVQITENGYLGPKRVFSAVVPAA
jgi:hypothetical protein